MRVPSADSDIYRGVFVLLILYFMIHRQEEHGAHHAGEDDEGGADGVGHRGRVVGKHL